MNVLYYITNWSISMFVDIAYVQKQSKTQDFLIYLIICSQINIL